MSGICLVSIAEIEGRGRSVVASQALKAGEVVLTDSPIVLYSALPFTNSSSYCNHCFRTLKSPPASSTSTCPCPCCPLVFCNPTCLSLASSSSHSPYACQALSRLHHSSSHLFLNQTHERLVQARFLIASYNLSLISPPDFQKLLSLQGTPTDNDVSTAHFLHPLIASPSPSPSPSIELTASLLAKDRLNAFGLMEPFNQQLLKRGVRAYAIYPKASFFNHDCLPNACRFDYVDSAPSPHNNTDMIVRILHDVPQGREICLSYFPVNLDYSTRQKRLLEDYGFACDCDRCKVEATWSWSENDNDNEEDEVMDEDEEEEDEQMGNGEVAPSNDSDDFPHAYFFMRYMCDRNNCGGTLAPLPPSPATPSNAMECNVCGNLKTDNAFGEEDA